MKGFSFDNLGKIFNAGQWMVKVPCRRKIAENFNRLSIGCTNVTDRQTTDGTAIAYSEPEHKFTFAKNEPISFMID